MFKKYSQLKLPFAIFTTILILSPFGVEASIPSRVLNVGSRGEEVRTVQIILNLDKATRLGSTGVGAPGQETDYFGDKTRSAIIKFQKKYRILGENGQIGPKTLKMLRYLGPKMIQAKKNKTTLIPVDWPESDVITPASPVKRSPPRTIASKIKLPTKVTPKISSVSPTLIANGGTVTIYGQGFTKTGNNIKTRYKNFSNISSADGKTLSFSFSIPEREISASGVRSLPSGIGILPHIPITLVVSNKNGTSNELVFNCRI